MTSLPIGMTGTETGKPVGRQWLKSTETGKSVSNIDLPVSITGKTVPKPVNHFFKKNQFF
jgi:hypothetical protein